MHALDKHSQTKTRRSFSRSVSHSVDLLVSRSVGPSVRQLDNQEITRLVSQTDSE